MRPLPKSSLRQPSQTVSSHLQKQPLHSRKRRRSPLVLVLLILLWCIIFGAGLAQATEPRTAQTVSQNQATVQINLAQAAEPSSEGTVDSVPARYQLGQQLYLDNCASCHIGLPPQILPTETWRVLIEDPEHYGVQIRPFVDPNRLLVWNYLRSFSRPLLREEPTPYRVGDSRYFKALHPNVELPRPITIESCASCHVGASQYNFRSLTPEWQG